MLRATLILLFHAAFCVRDLNRAFLEALIVAFDLLLEFLFKAKKSRGIQEELEAVSENIVLPAHLRRIVESLEEIKDFNPLSAGGQFPSIRKDDIQNVHKSPL